MDLPNIIKDFVENYTETIQINSFTEENGIYTAKVCDTSYLSECLDITVNDETAKVISISDKEFKFIFTQDVPTEINQVELDSFSFFHGIRVSTNNELIDSPKIKKQYFVWLPNGYTVEEKTLPESGYRVDFVLYALEVFNPKWKYLDHHNQIMYPLQNYAENLIKSFEKQSFVFQKSKTRGIIKHYADFGVLTRSGAIEKIFEQDLSGVEYRLSFEFYESINKKCCGKNLR